MTRPPHRPPLVLDRRSVREVDRLAIQEYGLSGLVMMENAARGLAEHALAMLEAAGGADRRGRVLIVCGSGNNGGDGYALARHLHNAGVEVGLASMGQPKPGSDAAINRDICARMNLRIEPFEKAAGAPAGCDLVVDAIFGTGLDRPVEGEALAAIRWINAASRPVLAADIPSGLDADTGRPLGQAVRASRTVTFVGLKPGFLVPESGEWTGRVEVVDIGVPRELVERLAIAAPGARGKPRR
jgi:hydroxyethylthiazole kinase-like uncharacterized protein yjeF